MIREIKMLTVLIIRQKASTGTQHWQSALVSKLIENMNFGLVTIISALLCDHLSN